MLRLILVRHGQTDANLNHFLQGQSDGVLNTTCLQQVQALGKHLKEFSIDHVISSPLRRAQQTAAAIAQYHDLEVTTSALIREWNCGLLDGVPAEVFRKKLKAFDGPLSSFRPEEGETLLEVRQRAAQFLDELMARYQGETVVVCSHGDFMRALLSVLQQVDVEQTAGLFFQNASYSTLELNDGRWDAITLNQFPGEFDLPASIPVKKAGLQTD